MLRCTRLRARLVKDYGVQSKTVLLATDSRTHQNKPLIKPVSQQARLTRKSRVITPVSEGRTCFFEVYHCP